MALVTITNDPTSLVGSCIVFEAVAEDADVKEAVYRQVTEHCGRDVIVASTTSSIDASLLAERIENSSRFLIAHPFQPVHMLPLVEVVRHKQTSDETTKTVCTLLKDLNRQVVVLNRSVPGFLVNRFAQALFRESIYLIEQGVSTAEDIDRAIKYAMGMRYASIGLLSKIPIWQESWASAWYIKRLRLSIHCPLPKALQYCEAIPRQRVVVSCGKSCGDIAVNC